MVVAPQKARATRKSNHGDRGVDAEAEAAAVVPAGVAWLKPELVHLLHVIGERGNINDLLGSFVLCGCMPARIFAAVLQPRSVTSPQCGS
jgi:hypothetical protein